jgi:hypothetical protein
MRSSYEGVIENNGVEFVFLIENIWKKELNLVNKNSMEFHGIRPKN